MCRWCSNNTDGQKMLFVFHSNHIYSYYTSDPIFFAIICQKNKNMKRKKKLFPNQIKSLKKRSKIITILFFFFGNINFFPLTFIFALSRSSRIPFPYSCVTRTQKKKSDCSNQHLWLCIEIWPCCLTRSKPQLMADWLMDCDVLWSQQHGLVQVEEMQI